MVLTHPDFTVARPTGLSDWITDAEWWLWQRLHELEPTSELGGIAAAKKGFHSTGKYNQQNFPSDYSIRDAINRTGPWWYLKCSALDWTFPEAQSGNYNRIVTYSQRLDRATRDPNDPRPDLVLFEWYGQADFDTGVEGWNELRDEFASSDSSHLWHIHFSFLRNKCGDFYAMWALLTILMGWSVAQWRASLSPPEALMAMTADDQDALKWRVEALTTGRIDVAFGPTAGEDVVLVRKVNALADALDELASRPAGTVVLTPEDKADLIAGFGQAAEAAVRKVLGAVDGATP